MYQAGLVLEGGGMRGVYTAGVTDALLENHILFRSVYGVSAGACTACSYLSGQEGRAFRVMVDYLDNPDYCSVKSLLKTGNLFGKEMVYSQIPNVLDPYDYEAYKNYEGTFYAVLTDAKSGEPVYVPIRDLKKQMWAIRASASMPLVSKTIVYKGRYFLDGGIADSIPVKKSMADGNLKNVVVLTRGEEYRKGPNSSMPLIRMRYPRSAGFTDRCADRHIRYNDTLDFIKKEEDAGRMFVIRPERTVEVGRVEKNREKLDALYQEGLEEGRRQMEALKQYLEN